MITRRHLLWSTALAAACGGKPGSGYRGYAFVATADPPSVAVVDLLAFAIKTRIELPSAPSELVQYRKSILALLPDSRMIAEIDAASRTKKRTLNLPAQPLNVFRHEKTLWCAMADAPQLLPVDPEAMRAEKPLVLPAPVVSLDFSTKEALACASLRNGSVVFIDVNARKIAGQLDLKSELGAVSFRSDGKIVMVAERSTRQLTAIQVAERKVMVQLPLALSPDRVCMKQDGGQMFLTGEGRDAVVIAYPYRTEIAQTSLSGRRPGEMAVSEGTDFLFVSNPEAGSVTVFDVNTQKVVAVTGVGVEPGRIVITPDQQYALVLNRASGDIAVIRIAAITPGKAKSAPLFTMIPVGQKPSAAVVTGA